MFKCHCDCVEQCEISCIKMGVKAKVKGTYSVKYQYLTALVGNSRNVDELFR